MDEVWKPLQGKAITFSLNRLQEGNGLGAKSQEKNKSFPELTLFILQTWGKGREETPFPLLQGTRFFQILLPAKKKKLGAQGAKNLCMSLFESLKLCKGVRRDRELTVLCSRSWKETHRSNSRSASPTQLEITQIKPFSPIHWYCN